MGDAVLAGAATVMVDTMSLGLSAQDLRAARRMAGRSAAPLRVIVSQGGGLDSAAKVFQSEAPPLVLFSTRRMPAEKRMALSAICDLWIFDSDRVNLAEVLKILREDYRVRTVVCEGGPRLLRALLEMNAVDEIRLTLAPRIFGGAGAPMLTGIPGSRLEKPVRFRLRAVRVAEGECYLMYRRIDGRH